MKPTTSPKPAPATPAVPARPAMPSRLTGVSAAAPRNQSEFLRPGQYMLTIKSVREGTTRAPALRPYFVVNATVTANDDHDGSQKSLRVGQEAGWMVMLDRDGALRDVRAFLDAAMTDDEKESFAADEDAFIQAILSDPAHFAGRSLMCMAENVKTKAGKDFTKVRWFPAPAADAE